MCLKKYFTFTAKSSDKGILQTQWRRLQTLRRQDISNEMYMSHLKDPEKPLDSVKFWVAVRQIVNAKGDKCFKELADFALLAFSLPISNAVVERVFSIMAIVKIKLKNRMSFEMLVAIIRIRIHLKVYNECCSSFKPSKQMLEQFNSNMYTSINNFANRWDTMNTYIERILRAKNRDGCLKD